MSKNLSIETEKVMNRRLKCYSGCLRKTLKGYFVETCSVHNPNWKDLWKKAKEKDHEPN